MGPPGPSGPMGYTGKHGSVGPENIDYSGQVGPRGDIGATGYSGATGSIVTVELSSNCQHNSTSHTHTRSTQLCIPPGSLNRVPASAGVRVGMSPLPGGR